MLRNALYAIGLFLLAFGAPAMAADPASLRLVPFPKELKLGEGSFALDKPLVLRVSGGPADVIGELIWDEMRRATLDQPKVQSLRAGRCVVVLGDASQRLPEAVAFPEKRGDEQYSLSITARSVTITAPTSAGLMHGVQTLCQLIRANRVGNAIPAMTIADWPSLRWRCFQDDLTRGPSSRLDTLKTEADLGAAFKLNLFTYYMEYQFAFKKHPLIGPEDGSLEPDDLRKLVAYARRLGVDVLGNQQSFGHFGAILGHKEYAALRETGDVLTPVKEQTYQLLDDLYSEVCPLVPFEMFNVCCDETYGLGTGPSKELAGKIGVGGVYVRHLRRVHDLLRDEYHKRMMMWGDIILQHPNNLAEIPKDTVMLTWGYDARGSFEDQIVPFAKSGYEFFVCPGLSNWSRILPDFAVANTNIRNFVRDGAKHGAIGMLNTSWEDDGEALKGIIWYGHAWAAECAWNASVTDPAAFNRRIGALLFGEKGDHFGQAIELLAKTHSLPGMKGMNNARFWDKDFVPTRSPAAVRASAQRLLDLANPAIEHLEACRSEATLNAHQLDCYLLGARRMKLIAQRMLDGVEVCELYKRAAETDRATAAELVTKAEEIVVRNRDAHLRIGRQFEQLWLKESKPYALDATRQRYQATVAWYEDLAKRLDDVRKQLRAGKPFPDAAEIGLAMGTSAGRSTRPQHVANTALAPDAPWAEASATARMGIVVTAGNVDRAELPVEVDVDVPQALRTGGIAAWCTLPGQPAQRILAQLDSSESAGKVRLVFVMPQRLAKSTSATVHVYFGLAASTKSPAGAARTSDASRNMKWLENDKVRLLLGPEGSHIYRWEIKALNNRDITMPGESGWAGFSDLGGALRSSPFALTCTAGGPALVRYRCVDPNGTEKTISLFGGVSWIEVLLNEPADYYWDFDNPQNFAADGSTPGHYLFSDGKTGRVGREADGVPAQVKAPSTHWAVKWNDQRLAMGMITPETRVHFHLAPGAGAGGIGIESTVPATHFITFAGPLEADPKSRMQSLCNTLNLRNPPEVTVHALEPRGISSHE